ncbi:alpha/beta fold hydrolase [Belnapia rosea]|uniref:Polyhydroxyalkanoate synthase n=1 Tax=Belnapia rosea TaxID=938405 RepID=A0A1G6U0H9_9PROT|nr:alpha/beta fold hydrolase [Belnapia rosea]SDD34828.1 polyhydroxyalkanoate synthase [Belnapia rosea]
MGPPRMRRGPRPLPLHLGLLGLRRWMAMAMLPLISAGASPSSRPGSPGSKPEGQGPRRVPAEAMRLAGRLAAGGHRPEDFAAAVWRGLNRADGALLAGIRAYRRHPWQREEAALPAVWTEGGSRLLDYGGGGPVVLVVPSLVNRAHILDLLPETSMLRHLAGQGLHPLLLDWGEPGEVERGFDLTDYIAGRLERALAAVGEPVVLVGYCMGGLLALGAAQRQPGRVRALALLATPWDFWAEDADRARQLGALLPGLEPLLAATGALPVDTLQALFAALDPFSIAEKYRGFARLDPGSMRARRFVALEDWLNDGIALAAPVAREVLAGWYGANTPARGEWRVAGEVVAPERLRVPGFLAIPSRDRIVPPASAMALAGRLPGALVHGAAAGHIGMVAGQGAEAALWQPLRRWLSGLGL